MKVITSYNKPDLDGIACMYAYSEFLEKRNEKVNYYIWGEPKQEVQIVCDMFNIELNSINLEEISKESEFIIVDLNGKDQMHDIVENDKIIEIIDHHSISKFVPTYSGLQRMQIDKLGAAATIVTERYKYSGIIPSRNSAILLFYGIISNSINLKANITKQRDIDACEWLKSICQDISEEAIAEIFVRKSQIEDSNLQKEMECEIPTVLTDFKALVGQLEVANLESFLAEKKEKIVNIMKDSKRDKQVQYAFINCIDILNGYVVILVADEESKKFLIDTFGFEQSSNNEFKVNRVVQRKELTAFLRKKYNK